LRRDLAGRHPGFVIATAARAPHGAFGHPDGPAGPVWGLWSPQDDEAVSRRYRLAELPQRGPSVEHSASNTDQPVNEAAFAPNDPEMLRRLDTPQPKPVDPRTYTDDGTDTDEDLDDVTLYDDDAEDEMYRGSVAPDQSTTLWSRRTRFTA
jgi:hypothetical protein